MRQLFVLGLLAALGWWVYTAYFADQVLARVPDGSSPVVSGGAKDGVPMAFADVLMRAGKSVSQRDGDGGETRKPANASTDAAAGSSLSGTGPMGTGPIGTGPIGTGPIGTGPIGSGPVGSPENGKVALDAEGQKVLDALIVQIYQVDAAAITQGWAAIASAKLAAEPEQRIVDALVKDSAVDGEFDAMLARLGTNNSFLHSTKGRTFADKVFAIAMGLQDAEAVSGGTRFLDLCLRGRIEKQHTQARAVVDRAYAKYRIRAEQWLCDPQNVAGSRSYTVAGGDSLNRISRRFRRQGILVDEGTIALLNRIHNKDSIQEGQRLKIPVDPVHAVIEKRSFSMAIYVGKNLLRIYWIGHGKNDKTPLAEFTVGKKQPMPAWTAPDGNVWPYGHPNNILGEYWIELRNDYKSGFGIHGTPEPDSICTMSSDGCVRMFASDIAELFEILPRGVTVEVRASGAP